MNYKAKIIVNADDFGRSQSVNRAILECFNLGIISTSTLMCNMPGFNEALDMIHKYHLKNKIGIHLNLTSGQPLTKEIKKFSKFYSNDQMYKSFKGHLLNNDEIKVVYREFQAQLERCIKEGINPTHIDSHHCIHHYWSIGKLVRKLAVRNKISAIRLRANWGNLSIRSRVYSNLYNSQLRILKLAKTKYFCDIKNVTSELLQKNATIEVMVHPYLNVDNIITDDINGSNLIELTRKHLPYGCFIDYP